MRRTPHIALLSIAVLTLSACGLAPDITSPTPTPVETTSAPPAVTPSAVPSEASPQGNTQSTITYWGIPGNAEGWEVTVFDQQGKNQIQHTATGCLLTYRQNRGALNAERDGLGPVDSVEAFFLEVEKETGSPVEGEVVNPLVFPAGTNGEGEDVEFATQVGAFESTDGNRYHAVVGAQFIDDIELTITAVCPSVSWETGAKDALKLAFSQTGLIQEK